MHTLKKLIKKVLIIGHSPYDHPYGASTSIREHYNAIGNVNIEFVHISRTKSYGSFCKNTCAYKSLIKNQALKDIYISPLPDSANYIFYEKSKYLIDKNKIFRDIFWFFKSKNIIRKLVKFQPDIIHFNSLVLSKLFLPLKNLLPKTLLVSHARELLLASLSEKEKMRIKALDQIVAIDSAVKKSIEAAVPMFSEEKIHIVQNPFKSSTKVLDTELSKILPIDNETISFSILGSICHPRGVGTVCEAFDKANLENSELIIFGGIVDNFGEKLKKRWSFNSKIKWVGHHANLLERGLFNHIDCVVRGEPYFCTGRTVYEMLFSGGEVILPGKIEDIDHDKNLYEFRNEVYFYEPRNVDSLMESFREVKKRLSPKKKRIFREKSNYEKYKHSILKIYSIQQ